MDDMSNIKSQISNVNKSKSDLTKLDYEQRMYRFALRLVKFLKTIPYDIVTREIVRQLIRSGTSISANYLEARSASSKKDYINFFTYSLKSANETTFWLNLLFDTNSVPRNLLSEQSWLKEEVDQLAKIIASSIITLKRQINEN